MTFLITPFLRTPLVAASKIKKVFDCFLLRLAFCLKHMALQTSQISLSSNED